MKKGDKEKEIKKLEKKIKTAKENINKLENGENPYNRNKIRRERKQKSNNKTIQPNTKTRKSANIIEIEEDIRMRFDKLINFIFEENKKEQK